MLYDIGRVDASGLIAAAPDYGLVIVYPLSALDEMISRYHSAKREGEYPQ
jgi:hypothetical protein